MEIDRIVAVDSPPAPAARSVPWGSGLQFGLGLAAVLGMWLFAFSVAVFGLIALLSNRGPEGDVLAMFLLAGSLAGSGALLLPSLYYGLMRLLGRPAYDSLALLRRARPAWWLGLLPLVLLAGHFISQTPAISWLLLPPLHLLAVGIPVAWMLFLGLRGLPLGGAQRVWGVFAAGLALGPLLISIIEMVAMGVAVLMAGAYLASDTHLTSEMMRLVEQMQSGQPSQEEMVQLFTPYLTRPGVFLSVLAFGALIVPLTEEALKSIGVWLLVGRRLTPAAGFAAGAISGAGYAFMESLLLTSNGQGWAGLMIARIGTSALHIVTTALMGWALASAWRYGRYLRLGTVYLGMVALHGTWNGLTLYTAFQSLGQAAGQAGSGLSTGSLTTLAPALLLILAFGSLGGLVVGNRLLARRLPPPAAVDVPPAPALAVEPPALPLDAGDTPPAGEFPRE